MECRGLFIGSTKVPLRAGSVCQAWVGAGHGAVEKAHQVPVLQRRGKTFLTLSYKLGLWNSLELLRLTELFPVTSGFMQMAWFHFFLEAAKILLCICITFHCPFICELRSRSHFVAIGNRIVISRDL